MRNLFVTHYGSRVNRPGGREGSRLHPSASPTSVLPSSHSTEARWPQSVVRSSAQAFCLSRVFFHSTSVRESPSIIGENVTGAEEGYREGEQTLPIPGEDHQVAKRISIPED